MSSGKSKYAQCLESADEESDTESDNDAKGTPADTEKAATITKKANDKAEEWWKAGKKAVKFYQSDSKTLQVHTKHAMVLFASLEKKVPGDETDISQAWITKLFKKSVFLNGMKGLCYLLGDMLNSATAAKSTLFGTPESMKVMAIYVGKE